MKGDLSFIVWVAGFVILMTSLVLYASHVKSGCAADEVMTPVFPIGLGCVKGHR